MPLRPFDGTTFVAFCDIAGFKSVLKKNPKRAATMLDVFYSSGFEAIRHQQQNNEIDVDGLFVSDCGVLHARPGDGIAQLESLCKVLTSVHQTCFQNAFSLATSIAYGNYRIEERVVFPGIEKNPIMGFAYLAAYADQSTASPKLHPPEIRLLKSNLPQPVVDYCLGENTPIARKMRDDGKHFYFEWQRL